MRDAKAGFGELKALWQAATRERGQPEALIHKPAHKLTHKPTHKAAHKPAPHGTASPSHSARATTLTASTPSEEAQLFRRAMQSVTPLASSHSAVVPRPQRVAALPKPSAEQLAKRQAAQGLNVDKPAPHAAAATPLSDHYVPHHLSSELGLAWHAPDTAADTPRRLQRGHWRVTASLDLHGLRVDAARSALTAFLANCVLHRVRGVRIIHGKGHGSSHANPVLRDKVPAWLVQHPDVCAFVQALDSAGGAGALLVLLRLVSDSGHTDQAT